MAEVSDHGGFLTLNVNLWYDKRGDNFHITTQDPDLGPSGLHCTLKRGTVSDRAARNAFEAKGLPVHNRAADHVEDLKEQIEQFLAIYPDKSDLLFAGITAALPNKNV